VPAVQPDRAGQRHRRAGQHQQVVTVGTQVTHPQPTEVEQVLAVARPVTERAEPQPGRIALVGHREHLQHARPAAQHRAAQPDVQGVVVHGQALDVQAVVLRRDRQERGQVLVGHDQVGQVLGAGCANHSRAPPVIGHPDELGVTIGPWLHGEPADHEPVRLATHPGETAERLGLRVVGLDPAADQAMRTCGPQPAARSRQTLQIGLGVRRPREIDEIGQREAALPVADGRGNVRIER
jgi:hypothetical protein